MVQGRGEREKKIIIRNVGNTRPAHGMAKASSDWEIVDEWNEKVRFVTMIQ